MGAVDVFRKSTGYDISKFFSMFIDFNNLYYDNYLEYYRGEAVLSKDGVLLVNKMKDESLKIEDLFNLNKDTLSLSIEMWELYEDFTHVKVKVETIIASPKWTRSSYVQDYGSDVNITRILKQGQSLEDLSRDLGYSTPDNDWSLIAVNNGLLEDSYDLTGGNLLKVTFSNSSKINSNSVVDIMVGKNILGKDLVRRLTFTGDDLAVLDPDSTLKQAVDILLGLTKGSVPEFPNDGIDSSIVGSNLQVFKYPMVFRQLYEVFRKDDTFKEMEVISASTNEDNSSMEVRIVSKLNDVLNRGV